MLALIFTAVLAASWGGTLLALLALILNRCLRDNVNVKLRYALLALVLVRFLLPVMPESPISVLNYVPSPSSLLHSLHENEKAIPRLIPGPGDASALAEQTEKPQNSTNHMNQIDYSKVSEQNQSYDSSNPPATTTLFALLWLLGVLAVLGGGLVFCVLFHLRNAKTSVANDLKLHNSLAVCQKKLNAGSKLRMKCIPNLHSPMITGIFSPTIYLPENLLDQIEERELSYILLHELVHWKRKDTLRTVLSFVAVSMHWFNPMAWLVLQHIKGERELLCDIHTLELLGEEHSTSYGSTIIRVSRLQSHYSKGLFSQPAFFSQGKQIRRRIIMIKQFHNGFSKSFTALSVALFILLSTITMTNAIGTQEGPQTQSKQTFTLLSGNYQYFDSLERLSRYAGIDYMVPNILPKNFNVEKYYLNHKMGKSINGNNVVEINFWYTSMNGKMGAGFMEEHFDYLVCKDSLIDYLSKGSVPAMVKQPQKNPKPVKMGGVNGYTVRTYGEITSYANNKQTTEGFYQCDYFIWQNKGLWYAVQYAEVNTFDGKKPYSLLHLSKQDVANIVTSLTKPSSVTHTGYRSTDETPSYAVYDNFDLERIQKDWGFQPVLPLELPGLKAKAAYMNEVSIEDSTFGQFSVQYSLAGDKQNKYVAQYSSSNSAVEFSLVEQEYWQKQAKTSVATSVPWQLMKVNGQVVYYQVDQEKGSQYIWKCGSFEVNSAAGIDERAVLNRLV